MPQRVMSRTPSNEQYNVVCPDTDGETVIAIVGSRTFPFDLFPDKCIAEVEAAVEATGVAVDRLVSGGADGVDTAAAEWAEQRGVPVTEIEPDYDAYGKAAPFKRNSTIVERADVVVALWNGSSKGTLDTLAKAKRALGEDRVAIHGIGGASPSLDAVPERSL
jgi:hypothetical protein